MVGSYADVVQCDQAREAHNSDQACLQARLQIKHEQHITWHPKAKGDLQSYYFVPSVYTIRISVFSR